MWSENSLIKAAGLPEQELPQRALYVVGLPIGNLGDITLRALWVLSHVDVVAAEDTRETRKLLDKFGITVRCISVREHNERAGAGQILGLLSEGKRVALVTDAGTPAISDPGARVVDVLQEENVRIIPIPGASAVVTALSASGLQGSGFTFAGFPPPQQKARHAVLASLCRGSAPFVLYEAPHRIRELLTALAEIVEPDRKIVVAREITKKFETFTGLRGSELAAWAAAHEPRGEYVVLVDEPPERPDAVPEEAMRWIDALRDELPASRLAAVAARVTGLPRQRIYDLLVNGEASDAAN